MHHVLKLFMILLGILIVLPEPARAVIPIYGWGAGTTGGDGKPVCTVTTLADDFNTIPHGSLREILQEANGNTCCSASNGCYVKFTGLSGDIAIDGPIDLKQSNVTIDGSTASNHGIQLYGASLDILASNVIVTQIRHRGNSYNVGGFNGIYNNFDILCGVGIVFDHVSSEWSNDKNFGIAGYNGICDVMGLPFPRNITIQNSIFAESILNVNVLVDGDVAQITFYHNVFEGENRNPQITTGDRGITGNPATVIAPQTGTGYYESINNFISSYIYGTPIKSYSAGWTNLYDVIGNYWQPGPNGNNKTPVLIRDTSDSSEPPLLGVVSIYAHDNWFTEQAGVLLQADCVTPSTDGFDHCDTDAVSSISTYPTPIPLVLTNHGIQVRSPQGSGHLATEASTAVQAVIFPLVGNSLPCRDSLDISTLGAFSSGVGLPPTVAAGVRPDETLVCLGIDAETSRDGNDQLTTKAFSTTTNSDLLVAFVAYDGPAQPTPKQTATVSGAGLPWQLVQRSNTQLGTAEIWSAQATNILTSVTVSSQPGVETPKHPHGSLTVVAFTHASGTGNVGQASAPSGAQDISLSGVKAGNWVFAVGNDWDHAIARVPVSGQVLVHQDLDTKVDDTYWVQSTVAASTADGSVDIHDSAPTNDRWNYAAVEIVLGK